MTTSKPTEGKGDEIAPEENKSTGDAALTENKMVDKPSLQKGEPQPQTQPPSSSESGDVKVAVGSLGKGKGNKEGSEEKTADKEENDGFKDFKRIFSYAQPADWLIESLAVITAFGAGTASALVNLVLGNLITEIMRYSTGQSSGEEFRDRISKEVLWLVYIGVARLVFSSAYAAFSTLAAYRIARNIRHAYVAAALSQEVAYFDKGTGGSVAMQATANGRAIQAGIGEKVGVAFQALGLFVAAFAVSFAKSWKLTLILTCMPVTLITIIGVTVVLDNALEERILKVYAQAGAFAETILASVRNVHAFGLRGRLMRRFDGGYLAEAHALGTRRYGLFGVLFSAEYTIVYLAIGLAFWQGIQMLLRGEIGDMGTIYTVLTSMLSATMSFTTIAPTSVAIGRAASAAGELFKLIDRKSEINPFDEGGEKPDETAGVLDIENVTFSYPTRPGVTVLDDFSLHVPPGKVTALVGASGSGKSTIIGLIERWYNPSSGTIKLDGRPITALNLNWLRTHVRLVQQEPVLFNGSVFNNIASGLVGTPLEHSSRQEQKAAVEAAATTAFAHDFISELPQGYDTRIGERGGLLSGGQKQRVAIARSIVSDPKVLLLDEATSALDPHAEGEVQKALDNVSQRRTTLVIAHRLSTIKGADNIVVMSEGRIVEQGTHEALIAVDGGTYARMVRAQNLSAAATARVEDRDVSKERGEGSGIGGGGDGERAGCEVDGGVVKEITSARKSKGGDGDDQVDVEKMQSIVRYRTAEQKHLDSLREREDFDKHKHSGFVVSVLKLVGETMEIKWVWALIGLATVLGGGVTPGQAVLLAKTMDVFTAPDLDTMSSRGNYFSAMFIALGLGAGVANFIIGYACNFAANKLSRKLRRNLLDSYLAQDLQFFDRAEHTVGALTAKLDSVPKAVFELMSFNIGLVVVSLVGTIGCSVLALTHAWKLGLVGVFASLPPMVLAGWARIRLESLLEDRTDKKFSASAALASEAVLAIRTVSSLAAERSVLERYTKELDYATRQALPFMVHAMVWYGVTQAVEYFVLALGFWYGSRLVSSGEVTFYEFFISFMGVFFAGQQTSMMYSFSSSFTASTYSTNYYFWLRGLVPTIQETNENRDKKPEKNVESIDMQGVRFAYPLRPDQQVLRGVSLQIQPGQFVALVGASGCGKSTVIGLLERFYDPSKGTITIDSSDLRDLNPRLYRSHVSLVQQEPTLYPVSIRDNVAFGLADSDSDSPSSPEEGDNNSNEKDKAPSDSLIESALRAANAWTFVSSLPDGLATQCGSSGGAQLSGGQRQRLAIARALARNPRVLLLDEATSALDTASERAVQAALEEASRKDGRITVAVAHRLSTVRDADVICVFVGGKIGEVGTHEELVERGGVYAAMCEAQSLDAAGGRRKGDGEEHQ